MTSQKDQIQRLIAEIEATLAKPTARLPLGLSGEAERQRQLLGKLFSYLQSLEQMFDSPGGWGPIDPGTGQFVSPQAAPADFEESASQVLQGLLLEMRYLRENSLKPMRQELESLQQRRDSVQAELNVLEAQRKSDPLQSEQQIADFLEVLMQRLQEQLSTQMVQSFAAMESAAIEQLSTADNPMPLLSGQRLEQVRLLQAQSDQLLLKLDNTLTVVFDSLQKSVDSYRESLEEGLDQMHGLGRQGEVIFHAFINHLAQQLGQDASSYLTGDLGAAVQQAVLQDQGVGTGTTEVDLGAVQPDELDQALDDLVLEVDDGADIVDPGLDIDSDLALLEDGLLPIDEDDDITLIQSDEVSDAEAELALLEDAIASGDVDIDEDITLIQSSSVPYPGVDLEEEITLIQTEDDPGLNVDSELALLEDAISSSDINLEELSVAMEDDLEVDESLDDPGQTNDVSTVDLAGLPGSFELDSALGAIDESLGMLALAADDGDSSAQGGFDDASNPDTLPQIEAEEELFNLDAGLELEPQASAAEPSDLLEEAELSDDLIDPDEGTNDVLFFDPSDVDGESTQTFEPSIVSLTDTDLFDANQVADNWLFDRGPVEAPDDASLSPSPDALDDRPTEIGFLESSGDVIPEDTGAEVPEEATVENLFGDSLSNQNDISDESPDVSDTVSSLSDLLPDERTPETVEDFPDNVPDDIYIAASADEDLINLVESGAEQHLLIDFDDGQLVEQLDEDLQKLADDTFSADYGVEEDDSLEPLDQVTLETIVNDLNLEDLNLDAEPVSELVNPGDSAIESTTQEGSEPVDEASLQTVEDMGLDLFEGFPTDTVDVDDPSDQEDVDVMALPSAPDDGAPDLDLLGLGVDPLEVDEFDDGLPDSLADELGGLSERSNALSQESTDEIVGQLLSDLEEPVIVEDEAFVVPSVEETEPRLDSASTPDLPPDLSGEELDATSPEADDFLQAEQAAFWQTMADDGETQSVEALLSNTDADVFEGTEELGETSIETPSDDMSLDAVSADLADDLDDLLLLDNLPLSAREAESQEELDLGDLDDLFGESSITDLEALDATAQTTPEDTQVMDPLMELGLELGTGADDALASETNALLSQVPPVQVPDVEVPDVGEMLDGVDDLVEPISEVGIGPEDSSVALPTPPVPVPPVTVPEPPTIDIDGEWFLGLDVGATGLSAVLMNRQTGQVYPLYWQTAADDTKHFRLPAVAVMTSAQDTVAVGYDALGDLNDLLTDSGSSTPELVGVNRLKPLLKVAVGHGQNLPTSDPWLRWSDTVDLPLLQVLQAMVALLKYLVDRGQVVGLEGDSLNQVWARLQGVIVGYPTNWPDTYSFNLREAVLAAGLIDQPEQILFVEDAIATILSGLPDPNDGSLSETVSLSRQPSLYNCQWQEGTVVISGGAVMTELGLVNLPQDLTGLNYADFALRGFAYAGDALDQDIVCQLLLPEERRQPLTDADATINWDWQGHLSAEDADWAQLNLDNLTLPTIGHVDWAQRYALQQRLLGSNLGQSLLAAARHLKLALQQQSHIQIALAGQRWLIKRRHLENLIFLPYIQRINRYLNVLLSHHSVDAQSIKQVICTGGSASLPAIARWLRQKFPNATIIQDTYASELPQSCSRVAYGLVNLARYGQVLNVTRQQYSDYFLLMELLRVFPQQPLPVGAIMHLLEQRGINTQACHLHILALLEGHLPPGLVPTVADRGLICDRTTDLPTYRALLQTPLFSKTVTESGGQMYIPNEAQAEQLRAYVKRLLIDKVQTLEEPLIAQLETFA
ncbi:hypothetical protein [Leptothoe spongobia]|uniref:Uncharacterized protein n=1 Tax=Leptothoe spongobia TAU-MAC 1115 TaxID=1967444 RepID=A0A947DDE6_9CYAN|nr:hypothetical protein [Leptothoe spongobia]MBT9314942.1 hypothetical protein [Leptothoe spongobia TAU-MAC 1115]